MKNILPVLLAAIILITASPALAEDTVYEAPVFFGNDALAFAASPRLLEGTLMVPLTSLVAALDAHISWDFSSEIATVKYSNTVIKLKEGLETANVNGEDKALLQPVQKFDGLLYAPLRFIAENLSYIVEWDEKSGSINIKSSTPVDAGVLYRVVGVTAGNNDGNVPENVLDRNYTTRWSSSVNGVDITLELDDVHPVAYIGIAVYNGDERHQTISVLVSENGNDFKEVVTKHVVSEPTLAMSAVDLGGVYDAKYVRILGYGNTQNEWNSITELSVYGPQEDGTMPVATDGPGAVRGELTREPLTDEQEKVLQRFEGLYSRLDKWYANLYHREDGGFFMAMSGRDDPNIECGLEMSQYALTGIRTYSDVYATMPDHVKQVFINYIIERQDPATGMFIDKQGPVNDRETARNQSSTMNYVNTWNIQLPYEHPSQKKSEGTAIEVTDTVMPEYFATVDSYINWVENNWDWDNNSWTAGDQTQQSLSYINYLPEAQANEYKAALSKWLGERQFEDTGYWSPKLDFNSVSGAFKVGLIYSSLGEKIPNADKVMETTIYCMENIYPDVAHYVRNPLSLLGQIAAYNSEYSLRIKNAIIDNLDSICNWIEQFLAPDGGFAMRRGRSMSNFGGIYGTHQLWEGDVDSTVMLLIARNSVYSLMGQIAPKIKFDPDFWSWIDGTKETPTCYIDESLITEAGVKPVITQTFEGMDIGAIKGNEFGGSVVSGMEMEIVKDRDRADNNCLKLSYDGSQGAGPSIQISGDSSEAFAVRYVRSEGKDTTVEFDLNLQNVGSSLVCYIGLGRSIAYAINVRGTELGCRIDSTNTHYGGTFSTLRKNEWYRIKVEYHTGATKEDFLAKIYVDGELVSTNKYYMNMLSGTPGDPYGAINVTWYRAGTGTILLDNIKISQVTI